MKPFAIYQHLEGEPLNERAKTEVGSKFWNKGKWDNFVAPFLPDNCSGMTLVEMGCNAGVFLKEAEDRGFERVVGVDSDKMSVERGRSWRDRHGMSYKFLLRRMEEALDDLPVADYTILANSHYYFTINDWLDYLDRLQYKTRYCIIVTAQKRKGNRCWARADLEGIRNYFKTWKEMGFIEGPALEGDPHPRQLWSLYFQSTHIDRVITNSLDCGNHVQDEFYGEIDAGKHYKDTRYYKILKPYRKEWSEEKLNIWVEGRIKVYNDLKENGLKKPILIDSNNLILDGNHRYSMMRHLGYKSILVRRI